MEQITINELKKTRAKKTKELAQLKADRDMYIQILKKLDVEIESVSREVDRLNNVYNGITKYEYLTDHALVRYLERSGAINVEEIKKNLLTETLAAGLINNANKVKIGGFEFIVKNGKVVTSIDK